jgi:hypothetical protein
MKLLVMHFHPTSRHFTSLRPKYSPQHPVNISQTQIKRVAAVPTSSLRETYPLFQGRV